MKSKEEYYDFGKKFVQPFLLNSVDKDLDIKVNILKQLEAADVIKSYIKGLISAYENLSNKIDKYCNLDDDNGVIAAKLTYHIKKLESINLTIKEILNFLEKEVF